MGVCVGKQANNKNCAKCNAIVHSENVTDLEFR